MDKKESQFNLPVLIKIKKMINLNYQQLINQFFEHMNHFQVLFKFKSKVQMFQKQQQKPKTIL